MVAFLRSDLFRNFAGGFALVAIVILGFAPDADAAVVASTIQVAR